MMKRLSDRTDWRIYWVYIQSALYALAGVNHFVSPFFYLNVMPAWMPLQMLLIQISGVVEILLGLCLAIPSTRKSAAWLLIAMLVIFLVLIHIPMVIDFAHRHEPKLWVAIVRLPIQLGLIWWAWIYTRK